MSKEEIRKIIIETATVVQSGKKGTYVHVWADELAEAIINKITDKP